MGGDDRDDSICAFLAFTRNSDLITKGAYGVDAAVILFFQSCNESVGPLILEQFRKALELCICRVLPDPEIERKGLAGAGPACAYGHAYISLRMSVVLRGGRNEQGQEQNR